jgi:Amt family ammonium transporter
MSTALPATMTEATYALTVALLLVAPMAIAGVALLNTGLGRSRSAAQSLLGSLLILATTVLVFAIVGICWTGHAAHSGGSFELAKKSWDWIGLEPVLMRGVAFDAMTTRAPMAAMLEIFGVALAAIIPWGSGADRWRLVSACTASAVSAGWIFPLFTHWIGGSGWLAQLGANFGLGSGFLDSAGAANVHILGGLTALCVVWIVGPRRGKFPKEGISTAIPGHQVVYVLLGCLLSLVGWMAWNAAAAVVVLGEPLTAIFSVVLNTLLCASTSIMATFFITQARFSKPDASLCANGWMAGLVASSACAALVTPGTAILIGCVAGVITPLLVELFELGLSLDDPSGAISVHGAVGIWGLIAVGLLGRLDGSATRGGQFLAQIIGITALLGLILPMTYFFFWIMNKVIPFRVDEDGERIGMDLHELGGGAYPEFVMHRDEFHR